MLMQRLTESQLESEGSVVCKQPAHDKKAVFRLTKTPTKKSDELGALLDIMEAKYSLQDQSKQLELLGIHLLSYDPRVSSYVLDGTEPMEAELREYWPGSSGDGGIDGLLFDPSTNAVTIIQATKVKTWDEGLAQKARSFFAKLPEWAQAAGGAEQINLNEKTRSLLEESQLNLKKTDVRMVFVTNLAIGSQPASKLFEIATAQTESYTNSNQAVSCEVWGQSEIIAEYQELQNAYSQRGVDATTIKFRESHFFQLAVPKKTVVGAVNTNEIRNLYKQRQVKNVLFNANIRMALGGKNKINKKMSETLGGDSESFFYYNNGVTATCSSFELVGNQLTVEGLQVVNGAQTVSTIGNSGPADDGFVLLRIIETGQRYRGKNEFPDLITKYQNTQNPVKASDFFSTDEFQEWLKTNLADRATRFKACRPFWYAHKRGWTDGKGQGVKVDMETLAKLRHSMLVDPNRTYNSPRDFWETENYWQAFGTDGDECAAWSEAQIAEIAWGLTTFLNLRDYVKEQTVLNKTASTPNLETGYLSYLSYFVTALAYQFLKRLQERDQAPSFIDMMSTKNEYEKVSELIKKIREMLQDAIALRQESQEANPKFYLARDKDAFHKMLESLDQKFIAGHIKF